MASAIVTTASPLSSKTRSHFSLSAGRGEEEEEATTPAAAAAE